MLAAVAAVAADLIATRVAVAVVIVRDRTAAVLTVAATPSGELAIGAVGVVGLQDLPHENKEVEEPTLLQSLGDRDIPVSFTQVLILNMRMGGPGTGIASNSDHAVGRTFLQLVAIEHDPERSQIDFFQHNLIRDDCQRSRFQVTADLGEFLLQGDEIPPDLLGRNEGWLVEGFAQPLSAMLQVINERPAQPVVDIAQFQH